ncbi:MAG: hypothetical protein KDG50_05060 [Chromatiales bacterium]|nr:hypothetical protein [Chromatiales bacterium]
MIALATALACATWTGVQGALAARGERGYGYSLDDVVGQQQGKGRRVLRAETVRRGDADVHELKVLTDDGRLRRERYDPGTGRRLNR